MKKNSKKRKKKSSKKQSKVSNNIKSIVTRYLILLLAAFPGLAIFYFIFTPLTAYPVYWILSIFYETLFLSGEFPAILLNNTVPIELVTACIAGSAYYLLLILNLSTPDIKIKKRVNAIVFSFVLFLILNIIRIVILSALAVSGSSYFDVTHNIFWYGLSTIVVVGIWFLEVKKYKINKIPFYSDVKFLLKESKK